VTRPDRARAEQLGRAVDVRDGRGGVFRRVDAEHVAFWPRGRRCALCGTPGHVRRRKHPRQLLRLAVTRTPKAA